MVNEDWDLEFPNSFINYLPEGLWDHCPGLLQFTRDDRARKKSFKFYDMCGLIMRILILWLVLAGRCK